MKLMRSGGSTRLLTDTVGGRNPAPVDMVNIELFTSFYTSQVPGGAGFLPSTV